MWDFLLITALLVQVFILENLVDEIGSLHENIPLGTKKDLHGTVLV